MTLILGIALGLAAGWIFPEPQFADVLKQKVLELITKKNT